MEPAVNVDDDRDSDGGLCCSNSDGEEREEEAFEHRVVGYSGIEQPVEHSEIDVHGIEDKFGGDEHRNQVTTRDKSEDADEKEQSAEYEKPLYWYVFYWYHITCPFLK